MSAIKRHFLLFIFSCLALSFSSVYANEVNALFHQKNDPVAGNPAGKITVVEFFDYQCSHCVNMSPIMKSIIKANPNVRVIYKELPIRGELSLLASRAALAANRQGKYVPFNHAIMNDDNFSATSLKKDFPEKLGLNASQFEKDMNSNSIANQISANLQLAQDLQVNGTPAFFIGKTNAKNMKEVNFVLGEMSQSQLQDAINAAQK